MQETRVFSLVGEDPLEKDLQKNTLVFLPGKSHGLAAVHGGHKRVGHDLETKQQY